LWKREQPILKPIQSVSLTLTILDQGWGNLKGQVDLKLCRGAPDLNCINIGEWNNEGSGLGAHVVYREIVANAEHKQKTV